MSGLAEKVTVVQAGRKRGRKRDDEGEESWKVIVRDISEVARVTLHNLVASNTPPLPRCYEQEFFQTADSLEKRSVLRLAHKDQDGVASQLKGIINGARDHLQEAHSIFSDFERDARKNLDLLDQKLREMHGPLLESGIGRGREIMAYMDDLKSTNESFLNSLSSVLENVSRQETLLRELSQKVHEDALTGVLNRRAWDQDLDDIQAVLDDGASPPKQLSIVMIDLDHFKKVNDVHGHPVGDAVLRQFAALLKDHFNSHGSVYRYGGEEFGVILPEKDSAQARDLAEQFRQRLNRSRFLVNRDGLKLKITSSFGVAMLGEDQDVRQVVARADRLLYRAKELGRDRVEWE